MKEFLDYIRNSPLIRLIRIKITIKEHYILYNYCQIISSFSINVSSFFFAASLAHIEIAPLSLPGRIRCEIHLPPLLHETHHVCQRDDWAGPCELPLQARPGEHTSGTQTFVFTLKTSTASSRSFCYPPPQPLMDCAVCYKMAAEQIESRPKPYVNCIQRPRLTKVL